jgi:hypothetical protein
MLVESGHDSCITGLHLRWIPELGFHEMCKLICAECSWASQVTYPFNSLGFFAAIGFTVLRCSLKLELRDRAPKSILYLSNSSLIFVLRSRPEEALQTVLPPPWNDVDMQMRDTLTHTVVDGDEGPLGL